MWGCGVWVGGWITVLVLSPATCLGSPRTLLTFVSALVRRQLGSYGDASRVRMRLFAVHILDDTSKAETFVLSVIALTWMLQSTTSAHWQGSFKCHSWFPIIIQAHTTHRHTHTFVNRNSLQQRLKYPMNGSTDMFITHFQHVLCACVCMCADISSLMWFTLVLLLRDKHPKVHIGGVLQQTIKQLKCAHKAARITVIRTNCPNQKM